LNMSLMVTFDKCSGIGLFSNLNILIK
jgi:hypothetical protein